MFRFSLEYQETTAKKDAVDKPQPAAKSKPEEDSPQKSNLVLSTNCHLFGYLSPRRENERGLLRLDLWKISPRYTIGRCPNSNSIIFSGAKISNGHCVIEWNGEEREENYRIFVHDLSSNGTWINGVKIGKGNTSPLRDKDEICFGTCLPQPDNGPEDYRYIYHHVHVPAVRKYYKMKEAPGSGAFGKVRRIVNRKTKVSFAMKTIPVERCVNEVLIMESLDHQNVCKLFEHFLDDSGHFLDLVMEYVNGGTLYEYIFKSDGGHPLSDEIARSITKDIQDGMQYIHSHGIAPLES